MTLCVATWFMAVKQLNRTGTGRFGSVVVTDGPKRMTGTRPGLPEWSRSAQTDEKAGLEGLCTPRSHPFRLSCDHRKLSIGAAAIRFAFRDHWIVASSTKHMFATKKRVRMRSKTVEDKTLSFCRQLRARLSCRCEVTGCIVSRYWFDVSFCAVE